MSGVPKLLLRVASRPGGAAARVSVDGVPVVIDDAARGVETATPVNEWLEPEREHLRPGRSRIRVDLEWPGGGEPVRGLTEVAVSLSLAGEEGAPLLSARFPPAPRPPGEPPLVEAYPAALEAPFDPPIEVRARALVEAERFEEIDYDVRAGALAAARALHGAFAAGDAGRAAALALYRTRDRAAAYGDDPEKESAKVREIYGKLVATKGFQLLPWEEAIVQTHLVAGGRLVWVTRGRADCAIRTAPGMGFRAGIHAYAARVGGAWTIAR